MPWIRPDQELSGQSAFKTCCCHECKPCRGTKCTTCTRSGGTQTRTLSTKSYKGRLISWSSHVALFTALLSLLALTCMLCVIPSQDQAARGEPRPRPRTQICVRCPRQQSAERSVKVTSLPNPWQQWPMSAHSLHTMHSSKQQTCTGWTNTLPRTQRRQTGMPAMAPRRHGTMQVEPSLTRLTSEVVKTHEGQLRRVRNLWQGPQHFCSSGDAIAFLTAPACLDTFLPVINTARYLHMTRQGEPVTAPVQRQSCRSATPIAACMPTRECVRDCRSMPGTVTIPHGVVGDIKPMRTDAHARSALECLMSQLGAYGTLLHYTIIHPERSLLSQHVLSSSAGLPRIEPLFSLGESP